MWVTNIVVPSVTTTRVVEIVNSSAGDDDITSLVVEVSDVVRSPEEGIEPGVEVDMTVTTEVTVTTTRGSSVVEPLPPEDDDTT